MSGSLGGLVLIVLFKNILLIIDNFQILNPTNLNGLNLFKPRGIKLIISTGILIRLCFVNKKYWDQIYTCWCYWP